MAGGGGTGTVLALVVVGVVRVVAVGAVVVPRVDVVGGAVTLGGLDSPRVASTATTAPAAARIGSAIRAIRAGLIRRERRRGSTWVTAGPAATRVGASAPPSWSRSAPPSAGRSAGFFASERSASATRAGGAPARTADSGGGAWCRWPRSTSIALGDSNGSRPPSIRYRITPNE